MSLFNILFYDTKTKKRVVKPYIFRAFLQEVTITEEELCVGYIRYADAQWMILLDSPKECALMEEFKMLHALGSFQEHKDGTKIAVLRAVREPST